MDPHGNILVFCVYENNLKLDGYLKWLDIYIADGQIICWILETRRSNETILFCYSQGEDKTLIYIHDR